MRIFFSAGSAPMLLASPSELNALHRQLVAFIASPKHRLSLPAATDRAPAPHEEFLPGLHIQKGSGFAVLSLGPDRWLSLTGSPENLGIYVEHFRFEEEEGEGHHHPDNGAHVGKGTMSLIIEADTSWESQFES